MELKDFKNHIHTEITNIYKSSSINNNETKDSEEFNRFVLLNEILDEIDKYEQHMENSR